jgi:hypothetical protein
MFLKKMGEYKPNGIWSPENVQRNSLALGPILMKKLALWVVPSRIYNEIFTYFFCSHEFSATLNAIKASGPITPLLWPRLTSFNV